VKSAIVVTPEVSLPDSVQAPSLVQSGMLL